MSMSHEFFSRPSNAFRQFFRERFPDVRTSHWREILAASAGLSTVGSLKKYDQAQHCDDMFEADAIILDRQYCRMRLEDFKVPVSEKLLEEIKDRLHRFWAEAGRPCPSMYWSLSEYLAKSAAAKQTMRIPLTMFTHNGKSLFDTIWWQSKLDFNSIPELPSGPIKPINSGRYDSYSFMAMPVKMKIIDKGPEDLPPVHWHQFPINGFPAECLLNIHGTRGVTFVSFEELSHPSDNAVEDDEWEDDEDEDEDEDEDDESYVPPGATCEFHEDRPAVASTEAGYLCEDCYEHYIDGYIRD